jgi:hypothetical protein
VPAVHRDEAPEARDDDRFIPTAHPVAGTPRRKPSMLTPLRVAKRVNATPAATAEP